MAQPIYAIGDIHGQTAMLDTALERIEQDGGAGARVVFLGDYCDRGPDSKAVLRTLIDGQAAGRDWVCLKGNHDRLFEWYLAEGGPRNDPHMMIGYDWFHERIGGRETALSYGVTIPERIRQEDAAALMSEAVHEAHLQFLRGLRLSHAEQGLFFAHAGVRPGVALDQQAEQDLLWIRKPFHSDTSDHGAFVVHGHTPVDAPEMHSNRLNIDTGAGYGKPLTAALFEGGEWFTLTDQGRQRL